MALDPSISLSNTNQTQLDPYGSIQKGVDLASSLEKLKYQPKLIQSTLDAQKETTLGQRLLNEQAEKEKLTRTALADLAKKNTTIDKTTGKVRVDWTKVGHEASQIDGMDVGTIFGYLNKGADQTQRDIKTASDEVTLADSQHKYAANALETANNLIRVQKDPQRASAIAGGTMSLLEKVLGKEKAMQYGSQYWNMPKEGIVGPDGKPDVVAQGQHFINQANTNAASTITPLGQEELQRSGISTRTGAQYRNTNSAESKAIQNQLIQAGIDPRLVQGRSGADLAADPYFNSILGANVNTGRASQAERGAQSEQQAVILDDLKNAASKVKKEYLGGLTIGNILAGKVDKLLLADPDFNNFVTRLQQAQAAGIPLDVGMGAQGVSKIAGDLANTLRKQGRVQSDMARSPTVSDAPVVGSRGVDSKGNIQPLKSVLKPGDIKTYQGKNYMFKGGDKNSKANWIEVK